MCEQRAQPSKPIYQHRARCHSSSMPAQTALLQVHGRGRCTCGHNQSPMHVQEHAAGWHQCLVCHSVCMSRSFRSAKMYDVLTSTASLRLQHAQATPHCKHGSTRMQQQPHHTCHANRPGPTAHLATPIESQQLLQCSMAAHQSVISLYHITMQYIQEHDTQVRQCTLAG